MSKHPGRYIKEAMKAYLTPNGGMPENKAVSYSKVAQWIVDYFKLNDMKDENGELMDSVPDKMAERLYVMFNRADTNGDGELSGKEFKAACDKWENAK